MKTSEFQRFVAWRYLLAKPMRLSSVLIGFLSLCLWAAASAALLHFEYPRSQILYTVPPNPRLPLLICECAGAGAAIVFIFFGHFYVLGSFFQSRGNLAKQRLLRTALNYTQFAVVGAALAFAAAKAAIDLDKSLTSKTLDTFQLFSDAVLEQTALGAPGSVMLGAALLFALLVVLAKHGLARMVFKRKQKHWLATLANLLGIVLIGLGVLALFEASHMVWLGHALVSVAALLVLGLLSKAKRLKSSLFEWFLWFVLFLSLFAPLAITLYEQLLLTMNELRWVGGFFGYKTPMEIGITFGIAAALSGLLLVLVPIRFTFSFFTTVSIGGVAIGAMALVMVLSVMAGFENDMRSNILGSNAHAVIRLDNEATYSDYEDLMQKVRGVSGVTGVAPFLTSEVLVAANNTYSNVIVKGIDPQRISEVSELKADLKEGDEYALEKLLPLTDQEDVPSETDNDERTNIQNKEAKKTPSVDPAPSDMVVPDDVGPMDFGSVSEDDDADSKLAVDDESVQNWGHSILSPRVAKLPGLIVGQELVNVLGLITGQEVMIVSPLGIDTPMGTMPRTKALRIAGEFYSGLYEYDIRYVYAELGVLQDFLDVGEHIEGLEIRFANPEKIEGSMAAIRTLLPEEFEILDWRQLNKSLFSALKLEKIMMFIVLLIIILVASFSIMGNLIMVVVEKGREIAILKTLGATDRNIYSVFVTQGLIIGLVGTFIGVALGLLGAWQLKTRGFPVDSDVYYIDKLPIVIEPWNIVFILFAGVLISGIATIYPAIVAAKTLPLDGMRPK